MDFSIATLKLFANRFLGLVLTCEVIAAEFLVEPLNATGAVNELLLTGEERVRCAGNIELNQRVLLTLVLDGFGRLDGGPGQNSKIRLLIQKNDLTILRMDALFHVLITLMPIPDQLLLIPA